MVIDYIPKGGGTDTSDATATVTDILSGKTAYVNDEKITGTLVPSKTYINGNLQTTDKAFGTVVSDCKTLRASNAYSLEVESNSITFYIISSQNDIYFWRFSAANAIVRVGTTPYSFYLGCMILNIGSGYIYCLGGANGDGTQFYRYDITNKTWTSIGVLPYKFSSGTAVFSNAASASSEIHIFGGTGYEQNHYKWDGSTWTSVSTIPFNLGRGVAVVLNGEYHILGGWMPTRHYKWDGSTWTSVSTIPFNFTDGKALLINNEIHILYQTYHYKWNGSAWTSVSTLPYSFSRRGATYYNKMIHLFGSETTNSIYRYLQVQPMSYPSGVVSPILIMYSSYLNIIYGTAHYRWTGSTWVSVSTLPYTPLAAIVYNNELHILGASSTSYAKYHYKWNGSTWVSVSTLPYNFRSGSFCGVSGGYLHIMGNKYGDTGSQRRVHYVWDGSGWTASTNLPSVIVGGSSTGQAVTDSSYDKLYISSNATSYVYKWDASESTWTKVLSKPDSGHVLIDCISKVITTNYEGNLWRANNIDDTNASWSQYQSLAPLTETIQRSEIATYTTNKYYIGGYDRLYINTPIWGQYDDPNITALYAQV